MKTRFTILIIILVILISLPVIIFLKSKGFSVTLIHPYDSIYVFSDFPVSLAALPYDGFEEIEIFVNDKSIEKIDVDKISTIIIGNVRLINLPVKISQFQSGNYNIKFVFKRDFLSLDKSVELYISYYKLTPNPVKANLNDIEKVNDFLSKEAPEFTDYLRRAREFLKDWKNNKEYLTEKEKIRKADIPEVIKESFLDLVNNIEIDTVILKINNSANYFNYVLYENGYPFFINVLDIWKKKSSLRCLTLYYRITDTIIIGNNIEKEKVYLLERIDNIKRKELFIGILQENSPFTVILNEINDKISRQFKNIISDDLSIASKQIREFTRYYIKDDSETKIIKDEITKEFNEFRITHNDISENLYKQIMLMNSALHEGKHLIDYKNGFPYSKCIAEILPAFFGENIKDTKILSISDIQDILYIITDINPEFSAYLYSLAYSQACRKFTLLELLSFITNKNTQNTEYDWAAKLILTKLAEKNGIDTHNLLLQQSLNNEREWSEIFKKLIVLPADKIKDDSKNILIEQFN